MTGSLLCAKQKCFVVRADRSALLRLQHHRIPVMVLCQPAITRHLPAQVPVEESQRVGVDDGVGFGGWRGGVAAAAQGAAELGIARRRYNAAVLS